MIQITKKQAREMLNHLWYRDGSVIYDKTIGRWTEKGYIKKSVLEESKEGYYEMQNPYDSSWNFEQTKKADRYIIELERALEEANENNR